ncbi:4-coumarate--CoA ligase-like 9 [Phragmites australis]|uniref:4-coumarate--CoA ligase-like 9 n=1 Tax=Phragmites australis TaxID=29695 RepID=UPI002D78E122|nr:4-coumarate--CoA ligase-like 9 [Phragmites australis]
MTQPNLTYTPLVLTAHKNCVNASMPSRSSRHHSSSRSLVSTNAKAAPFLLITAIPQEATSNNQQLRMGDAAIAVVEEEGQEHIFRSRFPPVAVPDDVTVPEFVLAGAEAYADKVALVEAAPGGRSYTYGEVARDMARFARALRSVGVRKGHVVVVALPNLAVYPVVSLGIMSAGAVFSGVNPRALGTEIKKQVEDSEAKLVVANEVAYDKVKDAGVPVIGIGDMELMPGAISWDELLAAADRTGAPVVALEPVQQSDLCALPYSSGTTGVSKGVMLSHRNLVSNLCSSMFAVGPELVGEVVTLGLMPFFHIYGITGICCSTLRHKGTVVVMDRFDLRTFLGALVSHRVMFAPVVPPVLLAMVKSPVADEFDLSGIALKSVMTAAAPLAPDLLAAFQKKFPGVQVEEAYGLTEHSCITLTHAGGDPLNGGPTQVAKTNSVGFILPNLEVKFVDPDTGRSLPKNTPGELCVRSQAVMQGYYKKKEETESTIDAKGWLHTGDVGYIDDDGDVFIVDRIKELIKYKGFQVAPAELEAILLSHSSVEDAAVFGLPDEEAGEVPVSCVVRRRGAAESEADIMAYVAARVASYKKLRLLRFVDAIPKSVSGKILRRQLRDELVKRTKTAAA